MKRNKNIDCSTCMLCIGVFFSLELKFYSDYGEIINPINDTVRIYNSDTIFTVVLDKENKFDYKFDWPSKKSLII